ncbi:MAG: nucleotidyltransferase family protein [Gammaproteobacteria bacterium]|nr:MAG: nucleotidyltransferase family protein [Gammaproteobacteria bacterium]
MIAMILAAGRGERMRPISDATPKALLEVAGVSLLQRHLRMLADAGAATVVINLGWLGEQIVERIGSGSEFGVQVVYSPEYEQVLETGGGIQRALPLLGTEPFWVVNADVYTDFRVPVATLGREELAHLVLVPIPQHRAGGDFALVDGKVRNAAEPAYTFSGIACYAPAFFAGVAAGRLPLAPLLRQAADQGHLGGSVYTGVWQDIGTAERLAAANRS